MGVNNKVLAGLIHGELRSVSNPMVDGITVVQVIPSEEAVEFVLFSESFSPVEFEELEDIPEIGSVFFESTRRWS